MKFFKWLLVRWWRDSGRFQSKYTNIYYLFYCLVNYSLQENSESKKEYNEHTGKKRKFFRISNNLQSKEGSDFSVIISSAARLNDLKISWRKFCYPIPAKWRISALYAFRVSKRKLIATIAARYTLGTAMNWMGKNGLDVISAPSG